MPETPPVGAVAWIDLTVPDAAAVRDFYRDVVGWSVSEVKMGDYADFCMHPSQAAAPVAGVCHARGDNADLPPQWLIYITVAELDASLARCIQRGGKVVAGPKSMAGYGRVAVIQDPAGAVAALFAPTKG
jgi:predicted enzyme related to lactoylglutathione lyase